MQADPVVPEQIDRTIFHSNDIARMTAPDAVAQSAKARLVAIWLSPLFRFGRNVRVPAVELTLCHWRK